MRRPANHAPRTGMAAWFGRLYVERLHPDGTAVAATMFVPQPIAEECDFWFCTLRRVADNADNFFGPRAPA